MYTVVMKRIASLILSLLSFFSVSGILQLPDSVVGHNFPLISVNEKAEQDVRVMSFNIRCTDNNGTPRALRTDLVVREILKDAPDLLGLQEATPQWIASLSVLLPEYGCVGVSRTSGSEILRIGEACVIFYLKERFDLLDHGDFWLSETPDKPSYGPDAGSRRVCTWAMLQEKETGALLVHVNTHLDNVSEEARVLGANLILDYLRNKFNRMTVILTADLNADLYSAPYNLLTETLTDTRFNAEDAVRCATWHHCEPENNADRVLDHILCTNDVRIHSFRVVTDGIDGRFVSDHFPVCADFTLPPPADSCAAKDFTRIDADAKESGAVRILSFNLRCEDVNGMPADGRRDIVAEQIRRIAPDSFGVQEGTTKWMNALQRLLPEYGWVGLERENGKPANAGGECCAVFYLKKDYVVLKHGDFWLSDTPNEPSISPAAACKRICTWAMLKNKHTGAVYVHVNTHFDHVSEAARVQGADIVNRYINDHFQGLPVVFTADMNTTPRGEAYRTMTSSLIDARLAAQDSIQFATFHACSPETHKNSYIDAILCSPEITVTKYRTVTAGINDRFVSDHFPICADMYIPSVTGPVC